MREEEKWKELKRGILRKIQYRNAIPTEIEEEAKRYFDQIIEVYKNNQCDNETIKKYSDGNKKNFERRLKSIEEERKSEQLGKANQAISGIRRNNLEREEELKHKEEIFKMEGKESAQVTKVLEIIKDEIRDIRSRQRNILVARGYSDDRIRQIDQKVEQAQRLLAKEKETYFLELLEKDSKTLTNQIINVYEEKIEQITTNEKVDPKQNFKKEIASNITLEEQKEYTEDVLEKQKQQEIKRDPAKTLPSNVLE